MSNCNKMPALLSKNDFENYTEFFNEVCDEVYNNIVGIIFNQRIISLQHPENKKTIWHIISKANDKDGKARSIDRNRAERITWIRQLLNQAGTCIPCDNYLVWAKRHKRAIRWCIYCPKEKYIVILEEHSTDRLLLITAFNVTPQRDIDYQREYKRYINFGI